MALDKEDRLFAPDKTAWMLAGGLESLQAGERQLLLVMAETKIQEGYKPSSEEKAVVQKLRDLAGDAYDPRDIRRKVRTLVKSRSRDEMTPLKVPPVFDGLLSRFRALTSERESDLEE
jgi:hypothetical protein